MVQENLFALNDIKKRLAVEANMFDKSDKFLRALIKSSIKNKFVNKIFSHQLKEELKKNKETLQ